jgi:hypothetical protein
MRTRLRQALAIFRERLQDSNALLDAPLGDFSQLESRALAARSHRNVRGIAGWQSQPQRRALYALARTLDGPFLEIGSWAGLSTSIIAYGIRDSGRPKAFVTCELDPKLDWWRPLPDGRIGFFPPASPDVPCGSCSRELFERTMVPVVSQPGGVVGCLRRNLERLGLTRYVDIVVGDFTRAPTLPYRFLFADTLHDVHEVRVNAPRLLEYLRDGAVFAADDRTSENEDELRKHLPLGRSFQIDRLFVGEIHRPANDFRPPPSQPDLRCGPG